MAAVHTVAEPYPSGRQVPEDEEQQCERRPCQALAFAAFAAFGTIGARGAGVEPAQPSQVHGQAQLLPVDVVRFEGAVEALVRGAARPPVDGDMVGLVHVKLLERGPDLRWQIRPGLLPRAFRTVFGLLGQALDAGAVQRAPEVTGDGLLRVAVVRAERPDAAARPHAVPIAVFIAV